MTKKIGILFGQEDSFPWALMNEINTQAKANGDDIEAVPVEISHLTQEQGFDYSVILDRISHEVLFYRTFLKCAVARGVQVVNNPIWWSADDKYFDNIVALAAGVAVPKTVLLPHKEFPPNTSEKSFRNMKYVNWDEVFAYLGFPIFLKPAYGGGWKDVYKCDDAEEFFKSYDKTRDLAMMAQEAIDFTDYYRCYVVGRRRVRVMSYAPKEPHHMRYEAVRNVEIAPAMIERVTKDALALCDALGYDLNTVEFALRDGVPIAIDFMNCAPDADLHSVGQENFDWIVKAMAEFLMERVKKPRAFEPGGGTWPRLLGLVPAVPAAERARATAGSSPRPSSAGTKAAKAAPATKVAAPKGSSAKGAAFEKSPAPKRTDAKRKK
jgi:glutathione synthase/RimK-type ligase-like ATP-grasp enzyme